MPAFNVRRSATINKELIRYAAPNGFVSIPIHTYIDDFYYNNDIGYRACSYSSKVTSKRRSSDAAFKDVLESQQDLAPFFYTSFKDQTNLTTADFQEMKFNDFQGYTDTIVSEEFEGVP